MISDLRRRLSGILDRVPRLLNWLSWAPPVVALAVSFHYTVNLPRSDYWEIAAPVAFAIHDGNLTLEKLREPVMGGRMTTTRMLYAIVGTLSGWDERADTAVIVLFSLVTYFCIRRIVFRTWSDFPLRMACMNLLASLLIFWLIMASYWVYSPLIWHSLIVSCVLGVVMVMSARSSPPLMRVFLSAILACAAVGAYVPGWIAWAALFGMIALLAWADRGEWNWWGAASFAAMAMAANFAVYRMGFPEGQGISSGTSGTLAASEYFNFFLRWLGNPFSSPPPWVPLPEQGDWQMKVSLAMGAVVLVITAVVLLLALIRCMVHPKEARRLAPWITLVGFGLAEGAAMTYGRAAMTPTWYSLGRYVTFSIWIYLGVLAILLCFPRVSAARKALRACGLAALPLFLVSYFWGVRFGLERIESDWAATLRYRAGILLMPLYMGKGLEIENDALIWPFAQTPDSLWQFARKADEAGLLRPRLVSDNLWLEADHRVNRETPVKGRFEYLDFEDGKWMASGWAVHTGRRTRVDAVVFTVEPPGGEESLLGIAQRTTKRLKWAQRYRFREIQPHAGWVFTAGKERWLRRVPGGAVVRAYAMDTGEPRLYRLQGEYRQSANAGEEQKIPARISISPN